MTIGIDASRANRQRKTGTEWYSYYLIRWLAKLDNKNKYAHAIFLTFSAFHFK